MPLIFHFQRLLFPLQRRLFFHHKVKSLFSLFLLLNILILCPGCSETPEQVYQRLNTEAMQHLADKHYAQAISTWNELLTLQPEAVNIYPKLAQSYLYNGQYFQALHAFQQHFSQHPEAQDTLINIMRIQLRLSDIAGARESQKKLQPFPATLESLIIQGDLQATLEQYQAAIAAYKDALAMEPNNQLALARLAVILSGQHEGKEAKIYYQQLETQNPTAPEILLQMGNALLLTGDVEKAEFFLQRAVNEAPDNQDLRVKLAELYIDSSEFSKAVNIFRNLLNKTPRNRFYKKMLFECLLLSKQFSDAELLFTSFSEAENQDIDFLLLKGKFYLNTGKYLLASSQLELALEKEPSSPIAHYFLALSHMASGQNNLGHKSLVKCLTLNPYFSTAELTLADYYYKIGEYELAQKHVTQIQAREPENFRSFLIQGNIALALGQYDNALPAFQKAYILHPSISEPIYSTAILSTFSKKPEQALTLYKNLLNRQPLLADATLLYTQLLCKQGKQEEVLKYLDDALAVYSDAPYLHHISGLIYLATGKQHKAIKSFNNALAIDPNMKESYLQLFNLYQESPDALEKILLQATSRISTFELAQSQLASLYNTTHKPEKAIALLEQALSSNPDSAVLANNLAVLYLEHQPNNLDETMRLASLAYENLSTNPALADTLGWVYYKKHLPIRAGWLLEEACGLEPDNPLILYHLAVVQVELDKNTQALKNLIKAKNLTTSPHLTQIINAQIQLAAAQNKN